MKSNVMTTPAQILEQFNNAFAKGDIEAIIEQVTSDIEWEMVGGFQISGKKAFRESLKEMEGMETLEMQIHTTIVQGGNAAVNGAMKIKETTGTIKSYGFCDLYEFDGSDKTKIKKMTSYVLPLKTE